MLFLVTTSEGLGGINVENIDVRRKQTNVFMMSLKYYSINMNAIRSHSYDAVVL